MSKTIPEWQQEIYQCAVEHGWHEEKRNIGEVLALIHSEVSEALEEWRSGVDRTTILYRENGKPEGFWIEMADVVIRVLDFAEAEGIDLETYIRIKHEYNKTRPYRHGGKKA